MRLVTFILLAITLSTFVSAQKKSNIVSSNGEAQIEWPSHISEDAIKKKVQNMAEINALERAFGRAIVQGNAMYVENINNGERSESNSIFNMISDSYVTGKVVGYKKDPVFTITQTESKDSDYTGKLIKCKVNVKAQRINKAPVSFKTKPLSCTNVNCQTTSFKNESNFYLFFQSPTSGYLTVFAVDTDVAFRLLPYKDVPAKYENGLYIEADKEYIFFAPDLGADYFEEPMLVDEMELTCENQQEVNRLYVLFSKEPINKPGLSRKNTLSEKEIKAGFGIPLHMQSKDFMSWMHKNKQYTNIDLQEERIDVTITK